MTVDCSKDLTLKVKKVRRLFYKDGKLVYKGTIYDFVNNYLHLNADALIEEMYWDVINKYPIIFGHYTWVTEQNELSEEGNQMECRKSPTNEKKNAPKYRYCRVYETGITGVTYLFAGPIEKVALALNIPMEYMEAYLLNDFYTRDHYHIEECSYREAKELIGYLQTWLKHKKRNVVTSSGRRYTRM